MKRLLLLGLLAAWSCTNDSGAERALRLSGYKEVRLTGYSPFKCAQSDSTCTGFKAVAPNGELVEGSVGCGLGACDKGCTIRL